MTGTATTESRRASLSLSTSLSFLWGTVLRTLRPTCHVHLPVSLLSPRVDVLIHHDQDLPTRYRSSGVEYSLLYMSGFGTQGVDPVDVATAPSPLSRPSDMSGVS